VVVAAVDTEAVLVGRISSTHTWILAHQSTGAAVECSSSPTTSRLRHPASS